jgi:hypothetical protein
MKGAGSCKISSAYTMSHGTSVPEAAAAAAARTTGLKVPSGSSRISLLYTLPHSPSLPAGAAARKAAAVAQAFEKGADSCRIAFAYTVSHGTSVPEAAAAAAAAARTEGVRVPNRQLQDLLVVHTVPQPVTACRSYTCDVGIPTTAIRFIEYADAATVSA